MGFTKLASSLPASSLWNQPDPIRIVFITLLAMCDGEGDVKSSIIGLAHLAREPLDVTEAAIKILEAPDPYSGCPEHEGRRLLPIQGGWHLVTHAMYRENGMSEAAKEYWRDKKRKQRALADVQDNSKTNKMSKTVQDPMGTVLGNGTVIPEGDSKRKPSTQKEVEDFCVEIGLPRSDGEAMWLQWQEIGMGKTRDWKAKIRKWKLCSYHPSQKPKQNVKPWEQKRPDPNQQHIDREYEEARKKYG